MECLELEKNKKEVEFAQRRITSQNIKTNMGCVENKLRRLGILKSSEDLVYTQNAIYLREKSHGGLSTRLTLFGTTREVYTAIYAIDEVLSLVIGAKR